MKIEYKKHADIKEVNEAFKNKKILSVSGFDLDNGDECLINFDNNEFIQIYHAQDCCEDVWLEDISGDTNLEGAIFYEIIEKECNKDALNKGDDSFTWAFYTIRTSKGYLDLRWYGTSNGYYSENIDFLINYKETKES